MAQKFRLLPEQLIIIIIIIINNITCFFFEFFLDLKKKKKVCGLIQIRFNFSSFIFWVRLVKFCRGKKLGIWDEVEK